MGSAKLKMKEQLHYRKTKTIARRIDGMHCATCDHYVPKFQVMTCAVFTDGRRPVVGQFDF